MTTDREEQTMLWKAAVKAIGRALKQEFQTKEKEMPDNIKELLSQLEAKGNPDDER
jgi:predicted GIY-YIG superfamily endonuclease